jgi:hypothetical protein
MRYAGESIGTFVLVFAVGAELSSRAPRSAMDGAARHLAQALGLPSAARELEPVPSDEAAPRFPLNNEGALLGTLLVRADLPA